MYRNSVISVYNVGVCFPYSYHFTGYLEFEIQSAFIYVHRTGSFIIVFNSGLLFSDIPRRPVSRYCGVLVLSIPLVAEKLYFSFCDM